MRVTYVARIFLYKTAVEKSKFTLCHTLLNIKNI